MQQLGIYSCVRGSRLDASSLITNSDHQSAMDYDLVDKKSLLYEYTYVHAYCEYSRMSCVVREAADV